MTNTKTESGDEERARLLDGALCNVKEIEEVLQYARSAWVQGTANLFGLLQGVYSARFDDVYLPPKSTSMYRRASGMGLSEPHQEDARRWHTHPRASQTRNHRYLICISTLDSTPSRSKLDASQSSARRRPRS
jgi:hypothetical protein